MNFRDRNCVITSSTESLKGGSFPALSTTVCKLPLYAAFSPSRP